MCRIAKSKPSVAKARKRMATADADLFVWASRQGSGERGLEVHGLSRGGGLSPASATISARWRSSSMDLREIRATAVKGCLSSEAGQT